MANFNYPGTGERSDSLTFDSVTFLRKNSFQIERIFYIHKIISSYNSW